MRLPLCQLCIYLARRDLLRERIEHHLMPPVAVRRALADSATKFAHRAVDAHLDGEHEHFYLFAGVALEHATKSSLARLNVAFIADNFATSRALFYAEEDASKVPVSARTIGGAEAVKRAATFVPQFAEHQVAVAKLMDSRNGLAHLGLHGSSDHGQALADMARAITSLLQIDADEFWGPHAELIRTVIDETVDARSKVVATKIRAAQRRFRERFGSLDEAERRVVLATRGAWRTSDLESHTCVCPACDQKAMMSGENVEQYDVDVDHRENIILSAGLFLEFRAQSFLCAICGLELEGAEELSAAGLETAFPNEDIDVDEYMAEQAADRLHDF